METNLLYTNECKALLIAATQISDLLEHQLAALKKRGMPTWLLLRALASDGAMTVSQLAKTRGISRQSVHKQVQVLIAQQLVILIEHPSDKRCKLVRLTNEGLQQVAQLESALDEVALTLARQVGDDDLELGLDPILKVVDLLAQACK